MVEGATDDELFYVSEEDQGGSDEPNWFCVNCNTDNDASNTTCYHCDAPRGVTSGELEEGAGTFNTFQEYMDGDQGATAALVEQFGPYAGMRAGNGESFDMDDTDHDTQLRRAAEERTVFSEHPKESASRPKWEESDLPSSVQSMKKTHPKESGMKDPNPNSAPLLIGAGIFLLAVLFFGCLFSQCGDTTVVVSADEKEVVWTKFVEEHEWVDVEKRDWRHNLQPGSSSLKPVVLRGSVDPVDGKGAVAGLKITSCEERHYRTEQYVCGEDEVPCTHSIVVDREPYDCSYDSTEDYSCPKTRTVYDTERYSCTKTRNVTKSKTYSCTKTRTTSQTKTYSCTKYRTKSERKLDRSSCRATGSGKAKCRYKTVSKRVSYQGTCTKSVPKTESYSSTCTKNYTERQKYNSTCSREVPRQESYIGTCTRPIRVPKTCHRNIYGPAHDHDIQDRYCDRDIRKPSCAYTTQVWKKAHDLKSIGKNEEPAWPAPQSNGKVRHDKSEKFSVNLSYRYAERTRDFSESLSSSKDFHRINEAKEVSLLISEKTGEVKDYCLCSVDEFKARLSKKK
jgi:hypothetical protein